MQPIDILVYDAPKVVGVADDDPEGHIPLELLLKGIEVKVPIWPVQSPDGKQDTLEVQLKRNDIVVFTFRASYTTPIAELEFIISIGPEHLVNDGVVEVSYTTFNYVGNSHSSTPRKLTIDHAPVPLDLAEVDFPAVRDGYLNCHAVPRIWNGIEVKLPPLPDFCRIGDRCAVEWIGYLSPNGSGLPINSTYKVINKRISSVQEISHGFSVTIEPFVPHIEPMQDRASALANYTLYRGSRKIGASVKALVRIDRLVPGEPLPCGP